MTMIYVVERKRIPQNLLTLPMTPAGRYSQAHRLWSHNASADMREKFNRLTGKFDSLNYQLKCEQADREQKPFLTILDFTINAFAVFFISLAIINLFLIVFTNQ